MFHAGSFPSISRRRTVGFTNHQAMQYRLKLDVSKRQKATDANKRSVPILALKNYDSLVMIAKELDGHSLVKLGKMCKTMHEKLKLLRGVRIPFDMGSITYNAFYGDVDRWRYQKGDRVEWTKAIFSKVKDRNPLFEPFVSDVEIHANVTGKILKKCKRTVNRMKAKKVESMVLSLVDSGAWEDLKDFIERFKIEYVDIYESAIPVEHQKSRVFYELPFLNHNGGWTHEYLMNTTRARFRIDQLISFDTFMEILKRWHTQKFKAWKMSSPESDFLEKCKEKYKEKNSIVTVRQKSNIPEIRPLLCDMGERNCTNTLALLLKDERVIFVTSVTIYDDTKLSIHEADEEKYPSVFKKILGIEPIQKKKKKQN